MRMLQSACPAGREQFSLPVVWGSPARWRVQGRSDGISRRRCSQSRQAGGKQCPQTRRSPTGSRQPTSSRTWGSASKCKSPSRETTSYMELRLKFETIAAASCLRKAYEILPYYVQLGGYFLVGGNFPNWLASHGEGCIFMWNICYLDWIFTESGRNLLQVCFY